MSPAEARRQRDTRLVREIKIHAIRIVISAAGKIGLIDNRDRIAGLQDPHRTELPTAQNRLQEFVTSRTGNLVGSRQREAMGRIPIRWRLVLA